MDVGLTVLHTRVERMLLHEGLVMLLHERLLRMIHAEAGNGAAGIRQLTRRATAASVAIELPLKTALTLIEGLDNSLDGDTRADSLGS